MKSLPCWSRWELYCWLHWAKEIALLLGFLNSNPPVMGDVWKGGFLVFTGWEMEGYQTACPKCRERWLCITGKCCSSHAAPREWVWVPQLFESFGLFTVFDPRDVHSCFLLMKKQEVNLLGNLGIMLISNFSIWDTQLQMCVLLCLFWSL